MAYCSNCGAKLEDGAKFCSNCGCAVAKDNLKESGRQQEYYGKVIKCPNCGAELDSFVTHCPFCGLELRGAKATDSVREFENKLEKIEAGREYEKPRGFLRLAFTNTLRISKADEQKISLIQSFAVPNTREDILEFMILASTNVNFRAYNVMNTNISKGEKSVSDAWLSKMRQVYSKAKISYGNDKSFQQIDNIYNDCIAGINRAKRRGILQIVMPFILLIFILIIALIYSASKGSARDEEERIEITEQAAQTTLENGEYTETLEYDTNIKRGDYREVKCQWVFKRGFFDDEIIEKAAGDGNELKYSKREMITMDGKWNLQNKLLNLNMNNLGGDCNEII